MTVTVRMVISPRVLRISYFVLVMSGIVRHGNGYPSVVGGYAWAAPLSGRTARSATRSSLPAKANS